MDQFDNNDSQFSSQDSEENQEQVLQEDELNHSDKMVGVITEPVNTFERTAKFPPRTIDWLLPVILMFLFLIISQIIFSTNSELNFQTEQKKREAIENQIRSQNPDLSDEEVQNKTDQAVSMSSGTMGLVFTAVGILIGGFIFFIILTGIYFLFSRFVLKGEGNFASALVANGLTAYIGIISIIVITLLSILMGRVVQDVSIATLLQMDKSNIGGWLLSFLDVFTIWGYIVLSIGLAKMFKAASMKPYFVMVFGLWIVWKVLIFALGDALPFLKNFGGM